jgi:hypothetical protein
VTILSILQIYTTYRDIIFNKIYNLIVILSHICFKV